MLSVHLYEDGHDDSLRNCLLISLSAKIFWLYPF